MANKLYEEESVRSIAKAIRVKLATPNGKKASEGDKYDISEMAGAIDNIPVRLGFPSTTATAITLVNGGTWKATGNGWVYYYNSARSTADSTRSITLTNTTKGMSTVDFSRRIHTTYSYKQYVYSSTTTYHSYHGQNQEAFLVVPVSKDDVVSLTTSGTMGATIQINFIPESEASKRSKLRPATT